jgi:hypothetical protein
VPPQRLDQVDVAERGLGDRYLRQAGDPAEIRLQVLEK